MNSYKAIRVLLLEVPLSENKDQLTLEARVKRLEEHILGTREALPASVSEAISAGENPVRAIRRFRLLTQRELSELCGLGENHISNIENGAQFNIRTAKKLAQALNVRIDDIS